MKIDKKVALIVIMVVIMVGLFGYVGYDEFQENQQQVYLEGIRYGQFLEQGNAINQIQTQGYYVIEILDENNQTQELKLMLMQHT